MIEGLKLNRKTLNTGIPTNISQNSLFYGSQNSSFPPVKPSKSSKDVR